MDMYEYYSEDKPKVKVIPDKVDATEFNTKDVLSALFLWLLFGYLSTMVGCDLQVFIKESLLFRHFIGLLSFFLLFTLLDRSNNIPVKNIFIKTIYTYAAFLIMIKMKWYFSIPILLLLVIDQAIKANCEYLEKNVKKDKECDIIRDKLSIILIGISIVGFIHYFIRQYIEFGNDFSIIKLIFGYKCKSVNA